MLIKAPMPPPPQAQNANKPQQAAIIEGNLFLDLNQCVQRFSCIIVKTKTINYHTVHKKHGREAEFSIKLGHRSD